MFASLPRSPFGGGVDSGLSELPLVFSFALAPQLEILVHLLNYSATLFSVL